MPSGVPSAKKIRIENGLGVISVLGYHGHGVGNSKNKIMEPKQVPLKDLKIEEEAEELMDSAAMQPYIHLAMAVMGKKDPQTAMEEIAGLPLEKRYVWRVASALKWAFVDFDDFTVAADRDTLAPEDREKVVELLKHRPIQFCMFLKALFGGQEMQRMMVETIKVAKLVP